MLGTLLMYAQIALTGSPPVAPAEPSAAVPPPMPAFDYRAFFKAHPDREGLWLDQISFPSPKDPGILTPLQPDHTMDAVAARLKSLGIKFQRGKAGLDTGTLPVDLLAQILPLPAGEPFIIPIGGTTIVSAIVDRKTIELDVAGNWHLLYARPGSTKTSAMLQSTDRSASLNVGCDIGGGKKVDVLLMLQGKEQPQLTLINLEIRRDDGTIVPAETSDWETTQGGTAVFDDEDGRNATPFAEWMAANTGLITVVAALPSGKTFTTTYVNQDATAAIPRVLKACFASPPKETMQ